LTLLSHAPKEVVEEARRLLGDDPAHGWPHVLRVAGIAEEIISIGGLEPDLRVLSTAIALHDVGRALGGDHHARVSATYARRLLQRLGWPRRLIVEIEHAILAHSYSLGVEARTLEAKILSDADKLDALGAVGIARVVHTGCQMGRGFEDSLAHIYKKILRLPELLYLEASRRLAQERVGIVRAFAEQFARELGENVKPPGGSG